MKLSTKIISLMSLVTLLTGMIVGSVTLQMMSRSFTQYLKDTQQVEIGEWDDVYTDYYAANGNSWENVQSVIVSYSLRSAYGLDSRSSYYQPVVLIGTDGEILAHPQVEFIGQRVNKRMIEHLLCLVYPSPFCCPLL